MGCEAFGAKRHTVRNTCTMVQCRASMLDGTQCTNAANMPRGDPLTCRMPSHVEQKFGQKMTELGLQGRVQEFITRMVCANELALLASTV